MTHLRAVFHKIWWLVQCTPRIGICLVSSDKQCISIRGTPVAIADIPAWYKSLLTKAEGQLQKALCGLKFPKFDELIAHRLDPSNPHNSFIDHHNNQEVGYSFILERKNGLQQFKGALLAAIFDDDNLNMRFHYYDSNSNPYPRTGEFYFVTLPQICLTIVGAQMAWFHDVSKLVDTLFLGFHVGPGGVARGTEIQTLSMENTETCHRNLLIVHGYLVAALRYNKTQHNAQMDNLIARFIPTGFGRIFLYYVVIIRSLERIWAEDVFGASESTPYKHLVFVQYAKPMESPQFSKVLYNSTQESLHIGLGIHDYRQFIKAVLRVVLAIDYDNGEEDQAVTQVNAIDTSFGHSSKIGTSMYGLSCTDLPNLTSDLLRLHQSYCQRVHRWLGEGEPLPKHVDPLDMTQMTTMFNGMTSLVKEAAERNPSQETITSTIRAAALDVVKEEIQNTLIPAIKSSVRAEAYDALVNIPWQYLIGADARIPDDCHLPVIVQPSTLRSLKNLLGEDAAPKSPEQAQLLQLVLDRQCHVIGVLPTGGGKSALYQAPSLCESSGMTVCIFPFRALTQDQVLQARNHGIPVATWPERHQQPDEDPPYAQHIAIDRDHTRLVCVSAHQAGRAEFLPWLKALRKNDILTRVVVDEAHQLLTSDFRSCIPNLRVIQELGVPILCLSGSLTPAAVPSLIEFFGFTTSLLRIVRADTPRPSISYHTVQVTEEDLFNAVVKEVKSFPLEREERGLVFCNSYDDCESLSLLTGIPAYYGRLDEQEKDERADMWRLGRIQRLICTSGFGNGVNNPHVRHAVHCRDPGKMDRYIQETGRIGRDGKKSKAVLFYTMGVPSACNIEPPDAAGQLAMTQYLSRKEQCKLIEPSRWLDGEKRVHSCSSIPFAELCDWCSVVRFSGAVLLLADLTGFFEGIRQPEL